MDIESDACPTINDYLTDMLMKIIIETEFERHTVEFTNIDISFEQVLKTIIGIMIGELGYQPDTILNEINGYLEEQGYFDEEGQD